MHRDAVTCARAAARPALPSPAASAFAATAWTTAHGAAVVVHGCLLRASGQRRIAVVFEQARRQGVAAPTEVAPGLTPREKEVAMHLLQRFSTKQIARRLGISPYTVQEHCTAIFDKAGGRSRRELVGSVFRRCYDPRNALSSAPARVDA